MNGVSVVIKTYNESDRIDRAIESAWAARGEVWPLPMEIVVADSLSVDGTVERARRWSSHAPVRVVQLLRERDRGCGSGVELGYAWSRGRWVLLMDGDMELQPGFLGAALAHLQQHPQLAGVGGAVIDTHVRNATDRIRIRNRLGRSPGPRPWLEGGGLYRRHAIASAGGHAADMRLDAFEEADLGVRLRRAGWRLERLDIPAVAHEGHAAGTTQVLLHRWRSGRAQAAGVLLRLHAGKPGAASVLRLLAHPLGLGSAWVAAGMALVVLPAEARVTAASVALGGLTLVSAVQTWRKGDARHVLASWMDWHLMLAGIVAGVLRPLPPRPRVPASRLLVEAAVDRQGSRALPRPHRHEVVELR